MNLVHSLTTRLSMPQAKRNGVQIAFAAFSVWIGWRFFLFYTYWHDGVGRLVPRPPSVEAYLPISALLALKYWLLTGVYDTIHPAGLTIFIAVIASALVFRRGFCSWICPVGTLSEGLWRLGNRVFGGNRTLPEWLDIPLRLVKYFLLAFFVYVAAVMGAFAIRIFLESPFNLIADVQMLRFFMLLGSVGLGVLAVLVAGSMLTRNLWCRYLCPYGALLGLLSMLSPVAVNRDAARCESCHTCDQVCPSHIAVSSKKRVNSPECTSCLACVDSCPNEEVLTVGYLPTGRRISSGTYGALLVGMFLAIILAGQVTGHWRTATTLAEYKQLVPLVERVELQHP